MGFEELVKSSKILTSIEFLYDKFSFKAAYSLFAICFCRGKIGEERNEAWQR